MWNWFPSGILDLRIGNCQSKRKWVKSTFCCSDGLKVAGEWWFYNCETFTWIAYWYGSLGKTDQITNAIRTLLGKNLKQHCPVNTGYFMSLMWRNTSSKRTALWIAVNCQGIVIKCQGIVRSQMPICKWKLVEQSDSLKLDNCFMLRLHILCRCSCSDVILSHKGMERPSHSSFITVFNVSVSSEITCPNKCSFVFCLVA